MGRPLWFNYKTAVAKSTVRTPGAHDRGRGCRSVLRGITPAACRPHNFRMNT